MRRRGDVVVHPLAARELLNRSDNPRMPFAWTVNPYRGCDFACTYCYARPTHEYLGFEREQVWEAFEREIFAKLGSEASLTPRKLAQAAGSGRIAIGTATDPYQGAELTQRLTRRILEKLALAPGLDLYIVTKSQLVERDIDVLQKIGAHSRVGVQVSISTVDDVIARRLEPRAPSPSRRLETVRALTSAGIATSVNLMPVVPLVTDSEAAIRATLAAAKAHGAISVAANPMFVPGGWNREGWDWLIARFPEHAAPFASFRNDPGAYERQRALIGKRATRLIAEYGLDGPSA